jgi:hypothetical protein
VGGGADIADIVSPDQLESLARKKLNGHEVRYLIWKSYNYIY